MKFQLGEFRIDSLFKVQSGMTKNMQDLETGNTPFISATERNNGIAAFIGDEPTFDGGLLTVSRNGSVAEVFYQPIPFCASLDDIRVLSPKGFKLNEFTALYLATLIRKEKFRYTYGRKYGSDRIRKTIIKLPINDKGEPDWSLIENLIKEKFKNIAGIAKDVLSGNYKGGSLKTDEIKLDSVKWKVFKYGGENGVFIIKNGYYNKKPDHTEAGKIPFIGASMMNNGVTDYYSLFDIENANKDSRSSEHELKHKLFKGNCITVANNGVGVGSAFYQAGEFTCSHDVNVLYLKGRSLNKFIAIFICTLIQADKYRWAYGRKWRPLRMPDSEIKLPIDNDGKPNWEFMEQYIMSLPNSAAI